VGRSRNGRVVERRRVCLWEPNRGRTASLEDLPVWQSRTTSPTIAFPASTSKVLLAFLLVPLELPITEVVEDWGEGGNLIQGTSSSDIETGEEGSSQVLVLEAQTL